MNPPLALIAELTHRCPLQCTYCANPLRLRAKQEELSTGDWVRVFEQAAEMQVLHVHLTGGEPLARHDLESLVQAASRNGLYTNLITSGVGLTEKRLDGLIAAGLEHIQLSFQDLNRAAAIEIAGRDFLDQKMRTASWIKRRQIAFTVNLVVHRRNLDRLEELIEFCCALEPQCLEIANVQYYGWAFENRGALLPTREQVEKSIVIVNNAIRQYKDKVRIQFVPADYYATYPKACMGGWGRQTMIVDPIGTALPCHSAGILPGLQLENVRDKSLQEIWNESPSFQAYRGEEWMKDPCRTCDRRSKDFGGCRCQAYLLAGDANAADPACVLSPIHNLVRNIVELPTQSMPELEPVAISPMRDAAFVPAAWLYRKLESSTPTES